MAIACAVAAAGCGSSATPHRPSADAGLKFADCMRSHGVSNFPDPSHGGGIQIPNGVNPSSPAFQAAQNACSKLLPGGGPGAGPASETRKLTMLKLARCMRAHGVTSFPDPTSSRPSAPPSGGGIAFGGGGWFIAVPQSLIQSPGFKQAAATCHFPGFGGGGPKGAATG
ncbi:MAG TPA: hypothetical protein VFB39_05215 [Solirubrobacteraceae bacterium]|nr:hypothetical protein [Solirubrobacteraceae bacterium]